jgi:hypothetical protein
MLDATAMPWNIEVQDRLLSRNGPRAAPLPVRCGREGLAVTADAKEPVIRKYDFGGWMSMPRRSPWRSPSQKERCGRWV